MKIYAIRDRLIDYYMTPFTGDTHRQVMAGLAQTINHPENMNAIAQTPQHFELWQIGEVDEDTGNLVSKREFVADCAGLVRPSVRRPGIAGTDPRPAAPGGRTGSPDGNPASTGTNPRLAANSSHAAPGETEEAHPGAGRVPSH